MLYLSTTCVEAPDHATALAALDRMGATHAWIAPGREPGARWAQEAERFAGRIALHHACLEKPSEPRWNLAAGDEALRRRSVALAEAAMRQAAELGSGFYSLHPGFALELTLDGAGRPSGPERTRTRSLDHLCRSLDRLASLADDLKLGLLVENTAGARKDTLHLSALSLWQEPDEIHQTLERLQAPPLGLLLNVGHSLLSARARKWEPEPMVAELKGWVRAIALSRNDGVTDGHRAPIEGGIELELAMLAGGLAVPVILDARPLEPAAVEFAVGLIHEALTPQGA